MEQVLNSHGAFVLGLFAFYGGIAGLKVGLWAVVLLSTVGAVGIAALGSWESHTLLGAVQKEERVAMMVMVRKGAGRDGTANL